MTSQAHSSAPFIASFFLLTACADLSPIEDNVCGNKVTETLNHEECDGESDCFAPGNNFQCRHKCIVVEDKRTCREPGYACGLDDVCRAPSGEFEFVSEITGSPTVGLARADFDADGRVDVLRESSNESFVQFYGEGFSVASAQSIVRIPNVVTPMLGPLNDDELSDVGFSFDTPQASGLVVYRTRPDGSLEPTIYPTVPVPAPKSPSISAIGVIANFAGDEREHEIIGFVGDNESPGAIIAVQNLEFVPLAAPPQLVAPTIAGLVVGDLDPSLPCQEVAFTQSYISTLWILRPCGVDGMFSSQPNFTELALPAPYYFGDLDERFVELTFDASIDPADVLDPVKMHSALHVTDINGDGRDDIIALATQGEVNALGVTKYDMFVALQDATGAYPPVLAPIIPDATLQPQCDLTNPVGPLLALGHFDDNGVPDVVTEKGIGLLSNLVVVDDGMGGPPLAVTVDLEMVECLDGHSWGRAVVGDFDSNGTMDIVATRTDASYFIFDEYLVESIDGLDVRRGDGEGSFTRSAISTKQPVKLLYAGDFDGDLVQDIAYVETDTLAIDSAETEARDELFAVFGRTSGGFDAPQTLGQVRLARWMVTGRFEGDDATDDIGLVTRPERHRLALSPVLGSGSRQLVSPFTFSVAGATGPQFTSILAIVPGRFHEDPAVPSFAVATRDIIGENMLGPIRLWRVSTSGSQAELDVNLTNAPPITEELDCVECVFSATDLDGDGLDELIVFGTFFGDMSGTSHMTTFEVDDADNRFVRRGSPVDVLPELLTFSPAHFAGPLNAPLVRDFNGDGTQDVAVIANTHDLFEEFVFVGMDAPPFVTAELVIFWNDHSGSLSTDRMYRLAAGDYEVLNTSVVQIDIDAEPELVVIVEKRDYPSGVSVGGMEDGGDLMEPEPLPDSDGDFASKVLDFTDGQLPTLGDAQSLKLSGESAFVEPEAVVAGDFDGDGVEDLLTGDQQGYIVLRGVPREP